MVHVTEKANIFSQNSGFESAATLAQSESTNRVKLCMKIGGYFQNLAIP